MSAHTPGPWLYGSRTIEADSRTVLITMDDMTIADARLIAAAPDMLVALRECASRLRYDGDHHDNLGLDSRRDASWEAMRMAEAAIAKATGAS